jgi:tetratricopeptide (TPR) repeat protein
VSGDSGASRDLAAIEREGHALIERRRYSQARVTVGQGLKEFPESAELQYLAAFIDYASERPEQAMQGVRALLSQSPQHYGGRTLYAHLLEGAKELAEAERVWIDLLRDYPQSADCFAGYGELMLKTLNLEKARRLAQEGLRLSPEHAGCLFLAAMIDLIRNRSGTDSEHLQRMLREHPEHVRSALALVIALSAKGNDRGALRVAQELLRQQPNAGHLVKLVRSLKMRTHWTMLPLYPMQRWGWNAAIAITLVGIVGLRVAEQKLPSTLVETLTWVWLGYVIYSWVWPRLLRRYL